MSLWSSDVGHAPFPVDAMEHTQVAEETSLRCLLAGMWCVSAMVIASCHDTGQHWRQAHKWLEAAAFKLSLDVSILLSCTVGGQSPLPFPL